MEIQEHVKIKNRSYLKVGGTVSHFAVARTKEDIFELMAFARKENLPVFIGGSGSNTFFSDEELRMLYISMELMGSETINETEGSIVIKIYAGENWDKFVEYMVEQGYSGIESLSGIPGTVGASPIQNIGAYGQEVSNTLKEVEVFEISTKEFKTLTNKECEFEYRNSVFKKNPGKYVVISITLTLSKKPGVIGDYPSLIKEFGYGAVVDPKRVREHVLKVRAEKIPNPLDIPNLGSFFGNPIISKEKAEELKEAYPEIPLFPHGENFKASAGWLIEKAGWKGRCDESICTHDRNALVICNPGEKGNAEEVIAFRNKIIESVEEEFGVTLEQEPNYIF